MSLFILEKGKMDEKQSKECVERVESVNSSHPGLSPVLTSGSESTGVLNV